MGDGARGPLQWCNKQPKGTKYSPSPQDSFLSHLPCYNVTSFFCNKSYNTIGAIWPVLCLCAINPNQPVRSKGCIQWSKVDILHSSQEPVVFHFTRHDLHSNWSALLWMVAIFLCRLQKACITKECLKSISLSSTLQQSAAANQMCGCISGLLNFLCIQSTGHFLKYSLFYWQLSSSTWEQKYSVYFH